MPRSKSSQGKHDKEVRKMAASLKRQGYDVSADITGYAKPSTIGGYRPDVVAKKGRKRVIVEVETADSVDSARDVNQQRAFARAASRTKNTTYKRRVVR